MKHFSILLLVYLLSYLMISTHRYLSFKRTGIPREKRFQAVVGMVLILTVLATELLSPCLPQPCCTLFPVLL
ncbi:hypothetical protein VU04_12035 [Desulfobulbus sp. TB]|nr:hypothetical protein [Desulfobulbus sp. TB]